MSAPHYFLSHLKSLSDAEKKTFLKHYERLGNSHDKAVKCKDEALQALPSPKRLDLFGVAESALTLMKHCMPKLCELVEPGLTSRVEMVNEMLHMYPTLSGAFVGSGQPNSVHGVDTELLYTFAQHYLWSVAPGHVIQTTDALEEMLANVDIRSGIPASYFRPPYPAIYIKFGTAPSSICAPLLHAESGEHLVEGCYILTTQSYVGSDREARLSGLPIGSVCRTFDVSIYGSAIGKANILDDLFVHTICHVPDENQPIGEIIDMWLENARKEYNDSMHNAHAFRPVLEHVAKILFYMGSRDARMRDLTPETNLTKSVQGLKSPSKIEKAKRKASKVFDHILVGPESLAVRSVNHGGSGDSRSVSTHWRRGHYRDQPHGPNNKERKLVFIEPILVRADLGGNAPVKDYDVM